MVLGSTQWGPWARGPCSSGPEVSLLLAEAGTSSREAQMAVARGIPGQVLQTLAHGTTELAVLQGTKTCHGYSDQWPSYSALLLACGHWTLS